MDPFSVSSPLPNQHLEPFVEDCQDAIVEDGEDLQIQNTDHMHMSSCHISLEAWQIDQIAKQAREIKKLNKQRDQAIKQARHWQAQAQQQRAKVCKLEAEHKELLQWVLQYFENEDEDAKQQKGESFSQCEERQNFPPGVPLPSWLPPEVPYSQPSVPILKQPVGPPPSYLIKRFQSQTSSSSSQKVLLGLNKAMAIGKTIGKKVVKRHAKETWKNAPVP